MVKAAPGLAAVLALLLVLALAPEAGAVGPTVSDDYNAWLTHMFAKYPLFTQLVMQHGLNTYIYKHLTGGGKLTLLAPTDAAFQAYLGKPACAKGLKVDDHRVLIDHMLNGRFPTSAIAAAATGTQFVSFGPDKVSKLLTKPLTMGLMQGKKTLASTKIAKPQSLANSRIVVHGIDKVLYVCRNE